MSVDVIVVGAGLVGSAIAYGMASRGVSVLVLDGNDRDYRASNANGALIWLQGKGLGSPGYQQLSRGSVDLWPDFNADLEEVTGFDLQTEQKGGLMLCMSEADFEHRRDTLTRWQNERTGKDAAPDWEMLGRNSLAKMLPNVELGPDVVGASYCQSDGQCNSLRLLSALHVGIVRKGGELRGGAIVRSIQRTGPEAFVVDLGDERLSAARVVIAAGLETKALATQVGLDVALRPQRGQMMITERLERFLPMPLHAVSQTQQGTLLIGTTKEEVGFDASTTSEAVTGLSAGLLRQLPALRSVKLVRQWAGLRIMTPDGSPIYQESESHPGAFVAVCHSGVTLAAAHAGPLAYAIAGGGLAPRFDDFHQRRFNVPKAA